MLNSQETFSPCYYCQSTRHKSDKCKDQNVKSPCYYCQSIKHCSENCKENTKANLQKEIKEKEIKENKELKEIKIREIVVIEDKENDDFSYKTLRVKKAQLIWKYLNSERDKKVATSIAKIRYDIEQLEKANPELKETLYNSYMNALKQAGLSPTEIGHSFMKYIIEDVKIPAVEEEYNRLYRS
jgi:hypothetical protein